MNHCRNEPQPGDGQATVSEVVTVHIGPPQHPVANKVCRSLLLSQRHGTSPPPLDNDLKGSAQPGHPGASIVATGRALTTAGKKTANADQQSYEQPCNGSNAAWSPERGWS